MKYFFIFLFPIYVFSQSTEIKGTVNSDSGLLSYASVSVLGSDLGVIADENGEFTLQVNISIHKTLFVSFLGHISQKIYLENSLLNLNNLKIILEEDINGLNEVVVTGSLKEEYVTESPVKVNVITSKKINSFIPSAGANITEIVQLVNGAQEVIACGVCYTNSISINGLEGPYTSVLLDGIPMYLSLIHI